MKVLYFGPLKDAVGQESESILLESNQTLDRVVQGVKSRHSAKAVQDLLAVSALVVNLQYVDEDNLSKISISNTDEVAFIPPVSSG
jgi:molybdopterin converting factor small subunit